MIKEYTHKDITWVDVKSPSGDEVRRLVENYDIHPLVGSELLSPTLRSRVDVYDEYIYLIFHFPAIIHSHNKNIEQEIDFIVGKNFIVTVHYDSIDAIEGFARMFDSDAESPKRERMKDHAGFIFFYMMRDLYEGVSDELNHAGVSLSEIEQGIFNGEEHDMVRKLSEVARHILHFKKALYPHKGILQSFEAVGKKFFKDEFDYYLRALSEEYYKIFVDLESYADALNELRRTNDSLLNTRTNDIMRTLTIMAFVTFPLMLFTSMFGMNTEFLPFVGRPNDFWIILGIMGMTTVGFFSFFKWKKWL